MPYFEAVPGALVDVEMGHLDLADVLVRKLIDERRNLLTRPAPDRRKIDEHRVVRLENLRVEVQVVYCVYVCASHLSSSWGCLRCSN